jgi:hypothetical protein
MLPVVHLRIVVLQVDADVWCADCAACCAVTVTYLTESGDEPPAGVQRLTYCETCERR